jgi:hypothetical protein
MLRHLLAVTAATAAAVAVPVVMGSAVASANPGVDWVAPIVPGIGLGGVGGPESGLGVLPGAGVGAPGVLPGVALGGVGGPESGLGVLPGWGVGLLGAGVI